MKLVLDASVVLKWLLNDPGREKDTPQAIALLQAALSGAHDIVQPPHWLAEVAAVLARLTPLTAADDVVALRAMEIRTLDHPEVWRRGCELAIETGQHLFDTLYHAVAIIAGAQLVTADERYERAARHIGSIGTLTGVQP